MKFGFFDSGLGGLLMMQSCMNKYPQYDYVYVGDTKNLPYGPRDAYEILALMESYLIWLCVDARCDYVFVACNTASVKALPLFIEKYPHFKQKIISIVQPTVDYINNFLHKKDMLLILATQATTSSGIYQNNILSKTIQIPMPGLVELIELNKLEEALVMVHDALSYIPDSEYVFLGCTHYVWLIESLRKKYPNITFITQDLVLQNTINKKTYNKKITQKNATCEYYVSAHQESYSSQYHLPVKKINLTR